MNVQYMILNEAGLFIELCFCDYYTGETREVKDFTLLCFYCTYCMCSLFYSTVLWTVFRLCHVFHMQDGLHTTVLYVTQSTDREKAERERKWKSQSLEAALKRKGDEKQVTEKGWKRRK